jgi:deazaflavin-dependent oxidoreductase (nitroreductase family)
MGNRDQPAAVASGRGGQGDGTVHRSLDFRSRRWRAGNAMAGLLARAGFGSVHLLTVIGRKTGRPHTLPVVPIERDGRRFLVAPYGDVAWVRNARAAGQVSLRYGRATRHYAVREVAASEAGAVLKRYVAVVGRIPRSYFSATSDSPVADFVAEAGRHPVLELTAVGRDPAKP